MYVRVYIDICVYIYICLPVHVCMFVCAYDCAYECIWMHALDAFILFTRTQTTKWWNKTRIIGKSTPPREIPTLGKFCHKHIISKNKYHYQQILFRNASVSNGWITTNYPNLGHFSILSTTRLSFCCPGHDLWLSWTKDFGQGNTKDAL